MPIIPKSTKNSNNINEENTAENTENTIVKTIGEIVKERRKSKIEAQTQISISI